MPTPGKKIEKLVLFTGFSCNEHCSFCIDLNKRDIPDKSTTQIVEELVRAKAKGVDYLELIGGEATIRGDFFPILSTAKKLGFKDIVIVTNGRMFSIPEFTKKVVDIGISDLVFSVHGHNAKLHDEMVATPGAFAEMVEGMRLLREHGFKRMFGNCTVTQKNMKHLPDIGRFFLEKGIHHVEFIFIDPTYGGGYSNFDQLVPRISEAAPYMRQTLELGRAGGTHDWTVRYVPLCYFPEYLDQVSEVREVELFHTRHWAPDFQNQDVGASRPNVSRAKTARCEGCALYSKCEGIWKEYVKRYGDEELTPLGVVPEQNPLAGSWREG